MKNRGSTPILTNLVGVHPRHIHTKFEANPCSGLRVEVEKLKSSRRRQQRRRRTQPDRYSHTHSLSVTKNIYKYISICHNLAFYKLQIKISQNEFRKKSKCIYNKK